LSPVLTSGSPGSADESPPWLVGGIRPDAFRLDGRTAIVTGGDRNIGASIALTFALSGAHVAIIARNEARLSRTVDEIAKQAPQSYVVPVLADVRDEDLPQRILAALHTIEDPLAIFVNNAADYGADAGLIDTDTAALGAVFETNLFAPLRLIKTVAPILKSAPGASIINVVSGAGLLPVAGRGAYGITKAALWHATRYLAVELAPDIRVNALCPGLVSETGEPRSSGQRAILEGVPMRRVGSPHEIAGAALYLASDASSYTTGELLVCNGGRLW